MPTKPITKIYNRDMAIVDSKDYIEHSSNLLKELVYYSTRVFGRCNASTSNTEEDTPLFVLYLHIMKMTDGIEVLVSELCLDASKLLLRSSFEALLSMEFILKTNTKERALAWLFVFAKNKLKFKKSFVPFESEEQSIQESIKKDTVIKNIDNSVVDMSEKEIVKIEKYIGSIENDEIKKEYLQKKEIFKAPKWYQLFEETNSISHLRDLAEHLNRIAQYDFLYRDWSTTTHAFNIENYLTTANGKIIVKPLRNREGIQDITNWTARFIIDATKILLKKYRPGENIDNWYNREISHLFPMK